MTRFSFALLTLLTLQAAAGAQHGNLLRNGDFQDDWLTLKPQVKNHHWCYSSEFYHRRDFNPDGWSLRGNWVWQNADLPAGQRRLQLKGPGSSAVQRVNWVLVHKSQDLGNLADAGRFPQIEPQRSLQPLRMVRDLTFRVRLSGKDVPARAGSIELALCPPGGLTIGDPLGTHKDPITLAQTPLPQGTFPATDLEVKLPAEQWHKAVTSLKGPKEIEEFVKLGPLLPGTVRVAIRYQAKEGEVELESAELIEAGPTGPNLLPNGSFEEANPKSPEQSALVPAGWTGPSKYRHFPGRLYYIFNTWHNGAFDNRGKAQLESLITRTGKHSLQMIVPAGDEMAMSSPPIVLKQKEARLIEVHAYVKTDALAVLNIDAIDNKGNRLDGHCFIHMAPQSMGSNDWRLIRQVFRPRKDHPVESLRIMLCARGVNGYTLDDTGHQPQNNVVGHVWWDDVRVFEPESSAADLSARGVKSVPAAVKKSTAILENLDLGERLLGENYLTGSFLNDSPIPRTLALEWKFTSPSGKESSFKLPAQNVGGKKALPFRLPYVISEVCDAYTEYRGTLSVLDENKVIASNELWFSTWTVPIDLQLGALYLRPEQKTQLVRMNFGLTSSEISKLASIRFEILRRGTGKLVARSEIPATQAILRTQLSKIPTALRDDLTNLLLTDVDISMLPLQPFADPQRNWIMRCSALSKDGKVLASTDSFPFCRLDHDAPQPAIQNVSIKKNLLYVNGKPWMPWGVIYGHCPVYDGPADPGAGKYLDLRNLPDWNMYDGFGYATNSRSQYDFNCHRHVAASITGIDKLEKAWREENRYGSSAYVVPWPVFSVDELKASAAKVKGNDLEKYLAFVKQSPMVVSTAPGIEEAFGLFHEKTPAELKGLEQVVDYLRVKTGRPVMVGHGGYWNRLEFEKVPFFDIFDPETEPWYPAPLHTDLWPLVGGKDKAIWLRPQMYEDVPYERWRFHTYVELMRGCRGWQMAHGPGDASLFRGLHGEMEFIKPIAYSEDLGPKVDIEPAMERWSRKHDGKTYIIAATTRGHTLGKWRWTGQPGDKDRYRVTVGPHLNLSDANSYGADQKVDQGPAIHGIHYLQAARTWPAGTKLVQTIRLGDKTRPDNLVVLVKADGRWVHAASWGKFDPKDISSDVDKSLWFLRSFYRHANGFLGWGNGASPLLETGKQYIPAKSLPMGDVPAAGTVELEIALDKIGVTPQMLLDGVGFAHQGGKVEWGPTVLIEPSGKRTVVWGDSLEHPPQKLAQTKISVAGLKKGTKIKVLFEDRDIVAEEGYFSDDFRGQDLYQRFGGGYGVGYGNGPVALHLYEVP